MSDVDDLLHGTGKPTAKFETVGTTWSGKVIDAKVRQQTDFKTGEPLFFKNGDKMLELVITLQTNTRDASIADDDGQRNLYARSRMLKAIQQAVRAHGKGTKIVGGTLAVSYVRDEKVDGSAFPAKVYDAAFAPGVSQADSLLGGQAPQSEPPSQPTLTESTPAAQPDPNLVAALGKLSDVEKAAVGIPVG